MLLFQKISIRLYFVVRTRLRCALYKKSKYVESDIGDSFRRIKMELINGRNVLFCGTPCQAAGLKRFLGKEYDNLIVCDFSCGGLPSHQMYDQYFASFREAFFFKSQIG